MAESIITNVNKSEYVTIAPTSFLFVRRLAQHLKGSLGKYVIINLLYRKILE